MRRSRTSGSAYRRVSAAPAPRRGRAGRPRHQRSPLQPPRRRPAPGRSPRAAAGRGRRRRCRPGQRALQEIRKYQKSTGLLIPKLPFARAVRSVCLEYTRGVEVTWEPKALLALQTAAEVFLIDLLADAYQCACVSKRNTLLPRDIQLIRRNRGLQDGLG
ncbi:histone H3-like centromeric protein A [Pantherophis guttatus]|uniref:Histone H3-like centromeric protein A n=1 Tax=Pantherophis guttatus TaxID=94885 RepID=A0ABM3Z9L5_PANGU|nr:histone H3-like centromeric protein A [Pantherophis guttatus]